MSYMVRLLLKFSNLSHENCRSCENNCPAYMAVEGKVVIPDGSPVVNVPVVLNGGDYRAISRIDGSFKFERIPSGKFGSVFV